MIKINFLLKFL